MKTMQERRDRRRNGYPATSPRQKMRKLDSDTLAILRRQFEAEAAVFFGVNPLAVLQAQSGVIVNQSRGVRIPVYMRGQLT